MFTNGMWIRPHAVHCVWNPERGVAEDAGRVQRDISGAFRWFLLLGYYPALARWAVCLGVLIGLSRPLSQAFSPFIQMLKPISLLA